VAAKGRRHRSVTNLRNQGAATAYRWKGKMNKRIGKGRTACSKHHVLGAEGLSSRLVTLVLRKQSHGSAGAEQT
jgi:hypothetical protein